jgi:hypothetical protein
MKERIVVSIVHKLVLHDGLCTSNLLFERPFTLR